MNFVSFSKHQSKALVALHPNCTKNALEPATGIEPVTCCLQNSCSAVELRRRRLRRLAQANKRPPEWQPASKAGADGLLCLNTHSQPATICGLTVVGRRSCIPSL